MEKITINVHRKEKLYYNIMIFFTILFCIPGLILLPYLAIFGVAILIATGLFIGYIKGSGVLVSKDQFPDLHKIVQEQCKRLSITNVPQVYIVESGGLLNAMATKFVGANYLIIYSDLYEVIMDGRKDIVEFIIGHELCHVKRNHVYKKMYVFPSLIVPFLANAYSRACEYTCDSVGYTLSPKGAVDGIKLLASGKQLYKKMNTQAFMKQLEVTDSFWVWLSEKLSTHPHLSKRITHEMLKTTSNKMLFSDRTNHKVTADVEDLEEVEIQSKDNSGKDHQRYMPKF